jgi:Pyruvate/2-oxoacid:ferredoxin oxidoreductase delta subunit
MEIGEVKIMSKITLDKDKCVNCKRETLYSKETHIDFRLGYVEGAGQLCLDCYGVIYGLAPKLQGKEKFIKKIKESGEA